MVISLLPLLAVGWVFHHFSPVAVHAANQCFGHHVSGVFFHAAQALFSAVSTSSQLHVLQSMGCKVPGSVAQPIGHESVYLVLGLMSASIAVLDMQYRFELEKHALSVHLRPTSANAYFEYMFMRSHRLPAPSPQSSFVVL